MDRTARLSAADQEPFEAPDRLPALVLDSILRALDGRSQAQLRRACTAWRQAVDAQLETVVIVAAAAGASHNASRGLSPQQALHIAQLHPRVRRLLIDVIPPGANARHNSDVALAALTDLADQLSSLPAGSWPGVEAITFKFCEAYPLLPKLLTTLVSLAPNIKTLSGLEVQPEDMVHLLVALPRTLQDLELDMQESNGLAQEDFAYAPYLAAALSLPTALTRLSFSFSMYDEAETTALRQALPGLTTLQRLELNWWSRLCNAPAEEVEHAVLPLWECPSLRELSMHVEGEDEDVLDGFFVSLRAGVARGLALTGVTGLHLHAGNESGVINRQLLMQLGAALPNLETLHLGPTLRVYISETEGLSPPASPIFPKLTELTVLCVEGRDDGLDEADEDELELRPALQWVAPALQVLAIHDSWEWAGDLDGHPAIRELRLMPLPGDNRGENLAPLEAMGPDTIGSLTALRKLKLYDPKLVQPDAIDWLSSTSKMPTLQDQMCMIGERVSYCGSGGAQGNRLEELHVGTPVASEYDKYCSTDPYRVCADVGGVLGAIAPVVGPSLTKLVIERCTVAGPAAGAADVMAALASIGRFEKLQALELIFDRDPVVVKAPEGAEERGGHEVEFQMTDERLREMLHPLGVLRGPALSRVLVRLPGSGPCAAVVSWECCLDLMRRHKGLEIEWW